jgi:sigma-B regulation protein RsbU (phosphoserine phosphatase)
MILGVSSPSEVLQRINALLIPENQQGMFVTIVYAVLSLETGRITYANAGHNSPFLLFSENQEIISLKRTGMALGIVENTNIDECVIQLQPEDCLLFYTDGVTEAISQQDDLFGDTRLCNVFLESHTSPAKIIIKSIEESVFDFMGSNLPIDDLTMLIMKRIK